MLFRSVVAGTRGVAVALEPIPDRLVVLTFDDAARSHYDVARPLLLARGFGATFFVLTGFHGTHVGVGVLYLACMLGASFRRNGLGADVGQHIEIAGLYWHFVDIVWIIIFPLIYLIP